MKIFQKFLQHSLQNRRDRGILMVAETSGTADWVGAGPDHFVLRGGVSGETGGVWRDEGPEQAERDGVFLGHPGGRAGGGGGIFL